MTPTGREGLRANAMRQRDSTTSVRLLYVLTLQILDRRTRPERPRRTSQAVSDSNVRRARRHTGTRTTSIATGVPARIVSSLPAVLRVAGVEVVWQRGSDMDIGGPTLSFPSLQGG